MEYLEQAAEDAAFVVLADVQLDRPHVSTCAWMPRGHVGQCP